MARLHKISLKICNANYKVQKRAIKYQVYKVQNIRCDIQIPGIKHDKIQHVLMRQKLGNGGEKLIGTLSNFISCMIH